MSHRINIYQPRKFILNTHMHSYKWTNSTQRNPVGQHRAGQATPPPGHWWRNMRTRALSPPVHCTQLCIISYVWIISIKKMYLWVNTVNHKLVWQVYAEFSLRHCLFCQLSALSSHLSSVRLLALICHLSSVIGLLLALICLLSDC